MKTFLKLIRVYEFCLTIDLGNIVIQVSNFETYFQ